MLESNLALETEKTDDFAELVMNGLFKWTPGNHAWKNWLPVKTSDIQDGKSSSKYHVPGRQSL